jgi:biotin operon repressor
MSSYQKLKKMKKIKPFTTYMKKLLSNEIRNSIDFIQAKKETVWWYNGEFIKFRSDNTIKLLNSIISNHSVSVRSLSEILDINKSAVQKQLKSLQEKGYIIRVDGLKGKWHVAIVCTTK